MNINLIYSFLALCEYKNMSTASKHLNISQQGLSKQIKSLERELGIKLFSRNRLGMELTKCGLELEPLFKDNVKNYEKMLSIANNYKKSENKIIKVGVGQGVTSAIGLEFILDFYKLYPDIKIEIIELYDKDCENQLLIEKFDFAFLVYPFDKSKFKCKHVYTSTTYVAINNNHIYASTKKNLKLKDLHNQPTLILDEKYVLRSVFDKKCEELFIKPKIVFTASSVASYVNLPNSITAIAIILEFFIQYIESDNVTILPLDSDITYDVYFCKNINQKYNKEFRSFENFIKDYFIKKTD